MFCKYCGKPLTGSLCPYCGKETILHKSSSELEKLMTDQTPEMPSKPVPEPEKTYQQGYSDGYQKGVSDSLASSQEKTALEKNRARNLTVVLCAIVFLLGAAASGWFFGTRYYRTGYESGYQQGLAIGDTQSAAVSDEDFKKEYARGYKDGYQEAEAVIKAPEQVAIPDLQNENSSIQTTVPETASSPEILFSKGDNPSEEVKKIQKYLKQKGYLNDNVDGIFGNNTTEATKAFQKANGLPETGIIDKITYDLMFSNPPSMDSDPAASEPTVP